MTQHKHLHSMTSVLNLGVVLIQIHGIYNQYLMSNLFFHPIR